MYLYSIGWTIFLLPNDISTGGVAGLSSIVFWAFNIKVSYTYFSFGNAF
ncbi:MAG: YitT family protein [Flavobacteriaceae bacterium]